MHAQSLIRFLEYCNIGYSDKDSFSVQRAKRQVNAEFALEESGIITIDGVSYNKSDVLKELEHPDFTERLQYHVVLWNHKVLLRLLEQDAINIDDVNTQFLSLANDEEFRYFLAPQMATAFNSVVKSLLKVPDFYNAFLWLRLKVFITPEEEEYAYQSLRIFLEEQLRLFKNLNSETYTNKYNEIAPWQRQEWHLLFNNLPDSLYYFNDEFAHVLINFTVQVQRADKRLCVAISSRLVQMQHVSYNYKKLIDDNHRIYTANTPVGTVQRKNKSPHMGWIATALVIVLLRLLMQAKSCNNDNDSNRSIPVTNYVTSKTEAPVDFLEVRKVVNQKVKDAQVIAENKFENVLFKYGPIYLAFQTSEEGYFPVVFTNNSDVFVTMHNTQGFDGGIDLAPGNSIIIGDTSLRIADLLIVPVTNLSSITSGNTTDRNVTQAIFIAPKNHVWRQKYEQSEMINIVDDLAPYQLAAGKKQLKIALFVDNVVPSERKLGFRISGAEEVSYLK